MIPRMDLSGEALIAKLKEWFGEISDHRAKSGVSIPLDDALMSSFAMFSLKFPSLLQFDDDLRGKESGKKSLASIYDIGVVPSDTQAREILDDVDPESIRNIFKKIFCHIKEAGGLYSYHFLRQGQAAPHYLVSTDGTGYFSSYDVFCQNCMKKKSSKTGETRYEHQMLAASIVQPGVKTVVPLCPEFIVHQDGQNKEDCEHAAFYRLTKKIREDHPKLKMVMTLDNLYACAPIIAELGGKKMNYIITAKPTKNKFLFEEIDRYAKLGQLKEETWTEEIGEKVKKQVSHKLRYRYNVQLNKGSSDPKVNFVEYSETTEWISKKKGAQKKIKKFSWITDLPVKNKEQALKIMEGGRARWKIENETFNTLKNQGYHFEHNFGHGKNNLSSNFAMLMLLAFLVDQAQEASCKIFQKALEECKTRTRLWERIRTAYTLTKFLFGSYTNILRMIIDPRKYMPQPIFDSS